MDLGLEGRTAVVTGAGRGTGLAVVEALAAEGVQVVAGARHSSDGLGALVQAGNVRLVQVDLAEVGAPGGSSPRPGTGSTCS
ncbi:SDR family NAD(P)-dependent oxidoreductase [Streptomyces sp. MJM1172]|uniref:SDR family NAD(P)-dependent oxidoreductase n=1 Tax=Streptomyces sp. MJM1172 TaxID=1703926 RepID=UPI000AA3AAFB|nr:SDR family NAD(P)-dependent oxidoreductase [Streptomyces sp. MJM1172]